MKNHFVGNFKKLRHDALIVIADYFEITIDELLRNDFNQIPK